MGNESKPETPKHEGIEVEGEHRNWEALEMLAVHYLRALKSFREDGGIDREPPLTNDEYETYDPENDLVGKKNLKLLERRLAYFHSRQRLEALEEELQAAGISPDRRASEFVDSLPEELREKVRARADTENL